MFGMGMGELLLILAVALLALGPEKLPGAAKSISNAIRGLRRQTRDLQNTLEQDTQLGDAMRELRSAMHGDPSRPPPRQAPRPPATGSEGPKTHTASAGGASVDQAAGAADDPVGEHLTPEALLARGPGGGIPEPGAPASDAGAAPSGDASDDDGPRVVPAVGAVAQGGPQRDQGAKPARAPSSGGDSNGDGESSAHG